MRITRFLDSDGCRQYGTNVQGKTALLLDGDFHQGLRETDQRVTIERVLAPIEPPNIFCIGLNYRAHAEETGTPIPDRPVVFMKPTTTIVGPGEAIRIPACNSHGPEVDYEAELAVVIGRKAHNVSVGQALDYVLGYTCANDVSARKWQRHAGGKQWIRGKGFDTFCPLGSELVTADEISDPQALGIKCVLNGKTMQDGNTSDMIFSVAELIAYLSEDTTLLPGTVILTGTPPGVGYAHKPPVFLSDGDNVKVIIDSVGELSNSVQNA